MEQLTYTNALGQSATFNSTGTYQWLEVDDLGGNTADFQTTASPYQDGVTSVGDAIFAARAIRVKLVIVSDNINQAVRTLNSVLNPKLGLATLTYVRGGNSYMLSKVKTRAMPSLPGGYPNRGPAFQLSEVVFEVFDPYFTDAVDSQAVVTTGANMLEFPLNITPAFEFDYRNTQGIRVTNDGDVDTPITLILQGPITSPLSVTHVETGERIDLALSLLENELLTITTGIDNINVVKTNMDTGISTVAFHYITITTTTFFSLPRGVSTITITAGNGQVSAAMLKYRQRWVGI
jgi:hypothetical protein